MGAAFIILFSLWTYPIISLLVLQLTKNKKALRMKIIYVSLLLSCITVLALFINISTTLSILDWLLLSGIYFSIALILWWTIFQPNAILKILATIAMIVIFGADYFLGTVGILGIGMAVSEFESDSEKWLADGIIYKEASMGNAVSDYRGKRIEIYKTIPWLPLIEWRIEKKDYLGFIYDQPFIVDYNSHDNKIYLSNVRFDKNWADTIDLR